MSAKLALPKIRFDFIDLVMGAIEFGASRLQRALETPGQVVARTHTALTRERGAAMNDKRSSFRFILISPFASFRFSRFYFLFPHPVAASRPRMAHIQFIFLTASD